MAAYLIYLDPSKEVSEVIKFIRKIYPRADPNPGFRNQLEMYRNLLLQK